MIREIQETEEPPVALRAAEAVTCNVNHETGSNTSMLDVPADEPVLERIEMPPPQEPEPEDPYVDDWAESQLY